MSTRASFILRLTIVAIIGGALVGLVVYIALSAHAVDNGCEVPSCGRQAIPTSATKATTTTVGVGAEGPNPPLTLGPCPKTDPRIDLMKSNAGVMGLGRVLIPIAATTVRTCRYGGDERLDAVGTRVLPNAALFESEVNRFPVPPPTTVPLGHGLIGADCPQDWYHLLTFANESQRVDVYESCGWLSNGVLDAGPSTGAWYTDLAQHYTSWVDPGADEQNKQLWR